MVGSGTVSKSPDKSVYDHNEQVQLTAAPSNGYQFDRWGGHLTGNSNPETLVMSGDKNVFAYFIEVQETVSVPDKPAGPSQGGRGETLTFTTGGSVSSLGHPVEYRFYWGDGNTSVWGSATQSYSWNIIGTVAVVAQARCSVHPEIISNWSDWLNVQIMSTGVEPVDTASLPEDFQLFQNFPNPFNDKTHVRFDLPTDSDVFLAVYNLQGVKIAILASGAYLAGTYRVDWNGRNDAGEVVPSGLYVLRMKTGSFSSYRRMLYLK